jgi:hypothetical protein
VVLSVTLLVWWADAAATSRPPRTDGKAIAACTRPSLDEALTRWLKSLCTDTSHDGCVLDGSDPIPVYFVSTEGGGIRAAAWTAFALDRLDANHDFLKRTFSISGVSGGALGAAVLRACTLRERETLEARNACLNEFARTDLLAPIIEPWLFEDVLARVVPTSSCRTPGCGVFSRGAWFEQALENGARELRRGLIETSGARADSQPHLPYLLLNSTWVETGERAIASDLRIDWQTFPSAKDQLGLTGEDMPLGTAAHNAARFPFINPIGSLHTPRGNCARRSLESDGTSSSEGCATNTQRAAESVTCGHLADGGYFDNSGGQSTLDVLEGFGACLSGAANPVHCAALSSEQRSVLRKRLVPQILMIRNGVEPEPECRGVCAFDRARPRPVRSKPDPNACPADVTAGDRLDVPTCKRANDTFVGLAGPALTVLQVSGIGANGALSEARQKSAVLDVRKRLGEAAADSKAPPVWTIDLVLDGPLYPLGWHLSEIAIKGMWTQASRYAPGAPCEHAEAELSKTAPLGCR